MAAPFRVRVIRYPFFLALPLFLLLLPTLTNGEENVVQPKVHLESQLLTGFTKARQSIDISSEVGGKCLAFHAEIGTLIPESGVLAEIDTTFIELDMQANRLELESIQRQLKTERKMLARYTTLIDKNSATEATLDEVTLKVDLHEMKLKSLANQYQRLQENLARHSIKAPTGWALISQKVEVGEFIQPGQIIATVGDYSRLIIQLALSHRELTGLQDQTKIEIIFPDLSLATTGEIYRISPSFDEVTKKIPVEILIDNPDRQLGLRGGLRGELRILQEKKDSFQLPASAIINRYNAHWLVRENGKRIRVLLLGTTEDSATAIISSKDISLEDTFLRKPAEDF